MNFQELKSEFTKNYSVIVLTENEKIVCALSSFDNFAKAIEEIQDATVKEIINCQTFDYGYIAEITVLLDVDGEEQKTVYTATATSIY